MILLYEIWVKDMLINENEAIFIFTIRQMITLTILPCCLFILPEWEFVDLAVGLGFLSWGFPNSLTTISILIASIPPTNERLDPQESKELLSKPAKPCLENIKIQLFNQNSFNKVNYFSNSALGTKKLLFSLCLNK